MIGHPHVVHLLWEDGNQEHIARRTVLPEVAEEVIAGTPVVRETYKQRLQFVGPTSAGRILSIVVGPVPDQPDTYYVFSARPASRKERRAYEHATGGAVP